VSSVWLVPALKTLRLHFGWKPKVLAPRWVSRLTITLQVFDVCPAAFFQSQSWFHYEILWKVIMAMLCGPAFWRSSLETMMWHRTEIRPWTSHHRYCSWCRLPRHKSSLVKKNWKPKMIRVIMAISWSHQVVFRYYSGAEASSAKLMKRKRTPQFEFEKQWTRW
jgi:hypothetical protein